MDSPASFSEASEHVFLFVFISWFVSFLKELRNCFHALFVCGHYFVQYELIQVFFYTGLYKYFLPILMEN